LPQFRNVDGLKLASPIGKTQELFSQLLPRSFEKKTSQSFIHIRCVDELIRVKRRGKAGRTDSWVFQWATPTSSHPTFLNCGKDYADVPPRLEGFAYFYGVRQGRDTEVYLGRVPLDKIATEPPISFSPAYPILSRFGPPMRTAFTPYLQIRAGWVICPRHLPSGPEALLLTVFHKGPGNWNI